MQLIINADDFGYDARVNRGILEGFRQGLLSSATLMTNMSGFDEAVEMVQEFGLHDKVGLHFNISEGVPLTEGIKGQQVFCRGDGTFSGNIRRVSRLLTQVEASDLRAEFEAQLRRMNAAGLRPSHLDSHHHTHTNLPVILALQEALRDSGIRAVRLKKNTYQTGLAGRLKRGVINRILSMGRETTDFFASRKEFYDYMENNGKAGKSVLWVEMMVHPVWKDGEVIDEWDDNYKLEAPGLEMPLYSYTDLKRMRKR